MNILYQMMRALTSWNTTSYTGRVIVNITYVEEVRPAVYHPFRYLQRSGVLISLDLVTVHFLSHVNVNTYVLIRINMLTVKHCSTGIIYSIVSIQSAYDRWSLSSKRR